jgi:hypothetical protein
MDAWMRNLLTMLYMEQWWQLGKPAIDKYGEIEELMFLKLSLLRMKFGYHKSK